MKLREFRIDRYGPLSLPALEPDPGIQIVYGPNESGKTLLLEALCRLLEPDTVDRFDGIDRVDHDPQGFVRVDGTGEAHVLDGEGDLSAVADLGARHLQNVFVVRDSDLRIRDHHDFYDSVIERLGEIHTAEIEAVQEKLEARGRVTPTTRNIASSAATHHAGDVREDAAALRESLESYVESAREDDVDALEAELIGVEAELTARRDERATLEAARASAEYEARSEDLARFRELDAASADLEGVSRESLERLAELDRRVDRLESTIEGQVNTLEDHTERVTELVERTADLERELRPYDEREAAVERAEAELDAFRERRASTTGGDDVRLIAGATGAAGIAAAGLTAATAGGLIQWILLAVGVAGLAVFAWQHRTLSGRERARDRALEAARDAGFDVDSVEAVGPAIGTYRGDRDAIQAELDQRERALEVARERRDDADESLAASREELAEAREELEATLESAGVPDLETYRERVERKDTVQAELARVRERLATAFGTPTESDREALLDHWEAELESVVAGVPDDATPADDDPERLETLEAEVADLDARQERLAEALSEHHDAVARFRTRLEDVDARPFLGEPVHLEAGSVEGLSRLADDLEDLVETIERDAAISRAALRIFDDIHSEEERKLASLFAPDGRAARAFQAMTGGRYAAVEYDPERQHLVVETADGETFGSPALSHATRDQLYLAARLSLGEQLLGGDPGFFLMDDPFLPADRERLVAGFETISELTAEGWQVLYFTAKPEVGETMAERFDLPVTTLDPL